MANPAKIAHIGQRGVFINVLVTTPKRALFDLIPFYRLFGTARSFLAPLALAKSSVGLFNPVVAQQQTLQQSVSYAGVGLHSGNRVNMSFSSGRSNRGLRFRRVDLEGNPRLRPALKTWCRPTAPPPWARAMPNPNCRARPGHVRGYEIDNATIELDANEPPIADGSARDYCKLIESAGIIAQGEKREPYEVLGPLEWQTNDTLISVFPHPHLKISCTSADKTGRFSQFFSVELTPDSWKSDWPMHAPFASLKRSSF